MHIAAAMRNNSANVPHFPNDDSLLEDESLLNFE